MLVQMLELNLCLRSDGFVVSKENVELYSEAQAHVSGKGWGDHSLHAAQEWWRVLGDQPLVWKAVWSSQILPTAHWRRRSGAMWGITENRNGGFGTDSVESQQAMSNHHSMTEFPCRKLKLRTFGKVVPTNGAFSGWRTIPLCQNPHSEISS